MGRPLSLFLVLACVAVTMPARAQDIPTQLAASSPVVDSGKRLFLLGLIGEAEVLAEHGLYYNAAVALDAVLAEGEPEQDYYRQAEHAQADCLLKASLPFSAFGLFARVVEAGEEHPHYRDALPRLIEILRLLPGLDQAREFVSRYPPDVWPEEYLGQVAFTAGAWLYSQGELDRAAEFLAPAPPEDEEPYLKSRYLLAAVRVLQKRPADALRAYGDILLYAGRADARSPLVREFVARAYLAVARVLYSSGRYALALDHYSKVPHGSREWLQSLFEMSWAHFRLGQNDRALGLLHTLTSPYFESAFFPESFVLQSVILYQYCRYEDAVVVVDAMLEEFDPVRRELEQRLAQTEDPSDFYYWLATLAQGKGKSFSSRLKRIFNLALSDPRLRSKLRLIPALDREAATLERIIAVSQQDALAHRLLGDILVARELAVGEAGEMARTRLVARLKDLRRYLSQAMRVKFEALTVLRDIVAGSDNRRPAGAAGPVSPDNADAFLAWPFEGEYWIDEMDWYQFHVENRCPGGNQR